VTKLRNNSSLVCHKMAGKEEPVWRTKSTLALLVETMVTVALMQDSHVTTTTNYKEENNFNSV